MLLLIKTWKICFGIGTLILKTVQEEHNRWSQLGKGGKSFLVMKVPQAVILLKTYVLVALIWLWYGICPQCCDFSVQRSFWHLLFIIRFWVLYAKHLVENLNFYTINLSFTSLYKYKSFQGFHTSLFWFLWCYLFMCIFSKIKYCYRLSSFLY